MGMSNYANYADVIEHRTVEKLAPVEYRKFIDCIERWGYDFDDYCRDIEWSYDAIEERHWDIICKRWTRLYDKVKQVTNIELNTVYHDAENQGDEVDGGMFCINNLMIRNPNIPSDVAITRNFYSTYG